MKILILLVLFLIIPITNINALQQQSGSYYLDFEPGETQTIKWGLLSDEKTPITINLYATREGNALLSFDKEITLQPLTQHNVIITITIPEDHENNVFLKPRMHAQQTGDKSGPIAINIEMIKDIDITIGNPVEKISPEQKLRLEKEQNKVSLQPDEEIKIVKEKPTCGEEIVDGKCIIISEINKKSNFLDDLIKSIQSFFANIF